MSADKKKLWIIGIALSVLTLAVFLPAFGFGWVEYDDVQYIRDNPHVAKGVTLEGIRWALTAAHLNYWQPLTWISHMIDCQVFGGNPGAHHLVNVFLHWANTLLVFFLLRGATASVARSACVAALFAVHPLHVEPVAWLAERKGLLSAFFCLLALMAYVRYARTRSWTAYALAALSFILACMAKPIAVTLPALLLLIDIWPLNRFVGKPFLPTVRRIVIEKLPFFAVAAGAAIITVWATNQLGVYVEDKTIPLGYRIWRIPVTYTEYVAKTLWPRDLNVLYPLPTRWYAWRVFRAMFFILVVSGMALLQLRRRPYLAVGWLWFLAALLPGVGLVAAGSQQLIADRFAYLPILGIFVMVVWGLADLFRRQAERNSFVFRTLAATAIILCACLSSIQLQTWRNATNMWANAIRINEHNPNNNADTYADIGLAVLNLGRPAEASNYLAQALAKHPDFPRAHGYYARALLGLTNYHGAIQQGEKALAAKPEDFITQHVVGKAYLALGNPDAAFPHFTNSLALYPEFFPEHGEEAIAMAAKGRTNEAMALLHQGMKVDPKSAEPHFRMAAIMEFNRNFRDAITHYRDGLRLKTNSVEALNNLAWILASNPDAELRNGKEAVALAEKACELTKWEQPVFMGTLAAAYAEAGNFDKAVETGQKARDLARSLGQFELAARNEQLLAQYRARKPWRETN